MGEFNCTPFAIIYDSFLSRVTSDMYMEMTEQDTFEQLQSILINAIPRCKLPRKNIFDYDLGYLESFTYQGVDSDNEELPARAWEGGSFNCSLDLEEINMLSLSMVAEWFGQQLATTENTRQKFSGSDFKFTSHANHMAKLKVMIDKYEEEFKHLQDIYKRTRRGKDGKIRSTLGIIMEVPEYGYKI